MLAQAFLRFYGPRRSGAPQKRKNKRTMPISSHLDRTRLHQSLAFGGGYWVSRFSGFGHF